MSNIDNSPALAALVPTLTFLAVCKHAMIYTRHDGEVQTMPLLSYMFNTTPDLAVTTITNDGKETDNIAQVGDVIMSGVFGEQYVLKGAKFSKLYQRAGDNGEVIPEQSPRQVAEVTPELLTEPVSFTASWGEEMVLKPGDFLIKDTDSGNVYRHARAEFLEAYDWRA